MFILFNPFIILEAMIPPIAPDKAAQDNIKTTVTGGSLKKIC